MEKFTQPNGTPMSPISSTTPIGNLSSAAPTAVKSSNPSADGAVRSAASSPKFAQSGQAGKGGQTQPKTSNSSDLLFPSGKESGILLSAKEAEEYGVFKRQKRIQQVLTAVAKAVLDGKDCDTQETLRAQAALAVRYGVAALKVSPSGLAVARRALLGGKVALDCAIGGDGRTVSKVKLYEAKLALAGGAQTVTLTLDKTALKEERWAEIKKEIKKIVRKARRKRAQVLVKIDDKEKLAQNFRLLRLAAECGAGVSVPYFSGVEQLKSTGRAACFTEVRGVESAEAFMRLSELGFERLQTSCLYEIYSRLMKAAEESAIALPAGK